MLKKISNTLQKDWAEFFPNTKRPAYIDYSGITGSVEGATTTFLAFSRAQPSPLYIVKIYRQTEHSFERIRNEKEILFFIHNNYIKSTLQVPRIILTGAHEDIHFSIQAVLPGGPLNITMKADGNPCWKQTKYHLENLSSWLISLQKKSKHHLPEPPFSMEENFACKIKRFREIFTLSEVAVDFTDEILDNLRGMELDKNQFLQHGDFCRQNILFSKTERKSQYGIIDWTDAQFIGLPYHDLFYLFTTYFAVARTQIGTDVFSAIFEHYFVQQNKFNKLIQNILTNYTGHLSLNKDFCVYFFGLFLINQSLFEYDKLERCVEDGFLPRFNLSLAAQKNVSCSKALQEQLWIYFYHALANNRNTISI